MIDIFRFLLASLVVKAHLWPPETNILLGPQAVFGFYTLSGYLMTRVLHERYGFSLLGFGAFTVNRVLRLWPAYLIVASMSLAALLFFPLYEFNSSLRLPATWFDAALNLSIIGQAGFDYLHVKNMPLLIPTSWSLSVELVSYLLLALYFGRTERRLVALAIIGLVAISLSTVVCQISPNSQEYGTSCLANRYNVVQSGFIPFAIGGLIYFRLSDLRRAITGKALLVSMLAFIGAEALCASFSPLLMLIGPFLGCVATVTVIALADERHMAFTDFFGRASYHLFIAHLVIAAVLVAAVAVRPNTPALFLTTIGLSLLVSLILVPMERRINRVRVSITRCVVPQARVH